MNEFNITVEGGSSVRLPTAGKYCDRDIVITATPVEVVLQSKTITPTKAVQEVTADPGHTALEKVTVRAIPDEYIIPSGTKNITENGTQDVKNYDSVNVNVPIPEGYIVPSGTKTITENGTHDVTEYASVNVNVASSGGGEENQLHGTLDGTLASIDSPVTKVIAYACYGITSITTVNLPNATSIGGNAFRGCSGITSFNAPKVTSLGTYAFYGCGKITEVNFQGVSQAPSTCFYQCTSLKKADFGVKCKTLAGSSFAYCSKLDHLILRYTDGVVSIATNTFSGANFDGYVYVPSALLADYEANSSWASYAGSRVFRAIEDYPDICG